MVNKHTALFYELDVDQSEIVRQLVVLLSQAVVLCFHLFSQLSCTGGFADHACALPVGAAVVQLEPG